MSVPRSTRWEPGEHDFVALQAARSGSNFNDFVRGAALVRASLTLHATDPTAAAELLKLYAEADKTIKALGRRRRLADGDRE